MRRLAHLLLLSATVLFAFAAGAQSLFEVRKTVGTVPGVCANTSAIQVPIGTIVTYCFEVRNNDEVDATYDLADDKLGFIIGNATAFNDSAVRVLRDQQIIGSVTNVGTWTITPGNLDRPGKRNGLATPKPQDVLTASATVTATGASEIPSLSDLGLVALGLGLAIAGAIALRSRLA